MVQIESTCCSSAMFLVIDIADWVLIGMAPGYLLSGVFDLKFLQFERWLRFKCYLILYLLAILIDLILLLDFTVGIVCKFI